MPELIGIAKMAAQSSLLEAKGPAGAPVEYFEIGARSILNRTKPNMPFQWTINPYRGCEELKLSQNSICAALPVDHQPLPGLRVWLPLLLRALHPRVHGHEGWARLR